MNPFTPGWGLSPPILVGRDQLLEAYAAAFDPTARTHRLRRSHLVGPRSTGKTVMLDAVETIAGRAGWHTISVDAGTPTSPLGQRIIRQLRDLDDRLNPPGRSITGVDANVLGVGGSVNWSPAPDFDWGELRPSLEHVTAQLDNGLLVTVDEIHEGSRDEIHELGNAFQHLTRKHHPIAIVMAGLPVNSDDEPTFLRRSRKPDFELFIGDRAIRDGFEQTARLEGWTFEPDALAKATRHAAGVPYMMQLIGYEAVDLAQRSQRTTITATDIDTAATNAAREYAASISAQLDVTRQQFRYLLAMAVDHDDSRTGIIAQRLGLSAQHANVFRGQLITNKIITAPRRGIVRYHAHWLRPILRSVPAFTEFATHEQHPRPRIGFDATQQPPTFDT